MTLPHSDRARFRRPVVSRALLPLALLACWPVASLAQGNDAHEAMLQNKEQQRVGLPGTLAKDKGEPADALTRAVADLGESPIAAILEAASPDVRRYLEHNMTLANPFFEGRAPGLAGNRFAAEYIEFWFKQSGLQPAFATEEKAADGTAVRTSNTSFRQPFQHGTDTRVERQEVRLDLGGGGTLDLKPGEEFTVLGPSGSGVARGPIALVGYSIEKGKDGYTSFPEGTDLSGKIAVIFRYEPMDDDGKSRWAERGWSPSASLENKLRAAADRKAAGIILVNPPGAADPKAKQLSTLLETRTFGEPLKIPVVMVKTEVVDRLLRAADPTDGPERTLMTFRKLADEGGGVVDLPNAPVSLAVGISNVPIMTDNVGGVLRGRGKLADEYIVIGAHYDHVGYGPVGTDPKNNGKLHPGADDNGSGTAGLLLAAEKLAKAYGELPEGAEARSILFLAFTAEESGLNGSAHYVDHPSIPISKMYLMLNMDMIGRLREGKLEVQGTESAEGFYDWLKPYFDESGLVIAHGPEVAGNSDHASFYRKKMPVLFFFTGLHREYHTPEDKSYRINQLGAVRVVDMVHKIAMGAAQRKEPLEYTPRRREAAAENPHAGADPAPAQPRGVGRVRFGVAPGTYSDSKPGVEVGDVYEGTPAEAAGIKQGDRMIAWNGKEVRTVEAWMPMLTSHKPGDEVEVTLLRDGKEIKVKVKLTARDEGRK